jgi:hypothetical protein
MKPTLTMPTPLRAINQTTESTSELQEQILQEQIRRRAFELYEQRGKGDGNELGDWLQAESEVVQQWSETIAA